MTKRHALYDSGWSEPEGRYTEQHRHLNRVGSPVGIKQSVRIDPKSGTVYWSATAYRGGTGTYIGLETTSGTADDAREGRFEADVAGTQLGEAHDV